jgi:hypothetical protein
MRLCVNLSSDAITAQSSVGNGKGIPKSWWHNKANPETAIVGSWFRDYVSFKPDR